MFLVSKPGMEENVREKSVLRKCSEQRNGPVELDAGSKSLRCNFIYCTHSFRIFSSFGNLCKVISGVELLLVQLFPDGSPNPTIFSSEISAAPFL